MKNFLRYLFAGLGVALSGFYLLNLSFGIMEIPDNLPIVGNIDEALASAILFSCLSVFGIRLPMAEKKMKQAKRVQDK